MKSVILALLISLGLSSCHELPAFASTPEYFNKVVDAIYFVEGGPKAQVPYGILSIKVHSKAEARQVCYNTVRNNYRRWVQAGRSIKAGKIERFEDFLADRYCPHSVDPQGNMNWKKNIKKIIGKEPPCHD